MPSTITHARAALITIAVAGVLAITLSPAYRAESLADIASFSAEATGAVSGFHGGVDAVAGRLAAGAATAVGAP